MEGWDEEEIRNKSLMDLQNWIIPPQGGKNQRL